jgi:hypothetical protein
MRRPNTECPPTSRRGESEGKDEETSILQTEEKGKVE